MAQHGKDDAVAERSASGPTRSPPKSGIQAARRDFDDELTLVDVWRFLARYRYLFLGVIVATTGLAVARALLMTPIYRAEVLLAPVADEQGDGGIAAALAGQLGGLATLAGVDLEAGSNKEEALAILGSRAFTERFIEEEDLLRVLFSDQWDESAERWINDTDQQVPTLWTAYNYFDHEIRSISEDSRTGLVTLAVEWEDRDLAAKWANLLVERVNLRMRNREIVEAEQSLDYLHEELGKASIMELRQAIYRLIENQINRVMLANVRLEYAFKVIDPAVPPDKGHYVRPKTMVMIVLSIGLGFFIALFFAFLHHIGARAQDK